MLSNTQLKSARLVVALIIGLGLSGCGTDPGDRALSGGLLGAGAGAAIGALTSSDSLNLGKPPWRHTAASYHHRRYARSDCATHETQTQRITTCSKTR